MTDKDIKDYCKNCDVEPPAMRFKCPECEHNTDNENIFAKDINVPRKEQIIIDGDLIKCPCYINKPLYRYDKGCLIQSQAFKEQQTEKKPILRCDEIENCPIKEQYKQLARKTQEFEQLEEKYEALKLENQEGYEIVAELKQECEELKNKLACQININNHLADYQVTANKLMDCYRKALEDIEKHIESYKEQCNIPNNCVDNRLCSTCFLGGGNKLGENILNIINKAKGEEKCQ